MLLENGLFIFRRDFRIVDNNGLNYINSKCKNYQNANEIEKQLSKFSDLCFNNAVVYAR